MTLPRALPRRGAVLLGGALVLAALLGAVQAWAAWRVATVGPDDARRVQERTVAAVRAAFADDLAAMQREAEAVARSAAVVAALRERGDPPRDVLAGAFGALGTASDDDLLSVEVLDRDGGLVAWDGPSFPRLAGPPPDALRTRAVADEAERRAVALWSPVREGDAVLGAVRVVRVAQVSVPVSNQYLQDYDLADEWRRAIEQPFRVRFTSRVPARAAALRGPDGTVLGAVSVSEPSLGALRSATRRQAGDVSAACAALLALWLLGGLGAAYVAALRRAGRGGGWRRAAATLGAFVGGLAATRYGLLALDVPVRWLDQARRPAALFDPALLASDVGAGALRSPADLGVSALFALVAAAAVVATVVRYRGVGRGPGGGGRGAAAVAAVAGAAALAAVVGSVWVRQAVLDATIRYADRTASLVDGPMLVVLAGLVAALAALALVVAAAVVLAVGSRPAPPARGARARGGAVAALAVATAAAVAAVAGGPVAPSAALVALGAGLGLGLGGSTERWVQPLTFRGVLLGALVLAPVLYGFMHEPLRERSEDLLSDAAYAFSSARDERVSLAIEQVLGDARADDALGPVLLEAVAEADSARAAGRAPADSTRQRLDALSAGLVTSSLLGSLADVATELRLVGPAGETLGSYVEGGAAPPSGPGDPLGFGAMLGEYLARDERGSFRRRLPVSERRGLSRTAAIGPLLTADDETVAWIYLRATPRTARFATETPFPRVLAPTGLFGLDDEALSYAEYDDGVLVRSRGEAPLRLDSTVYRVLSDRASGYGRSETLGGRPTRAYYQRLGDDAEDVVAVRAPAEDGLDVLFVLLRLSLAGLALGGVVWLAGLWARWRGGLVPAPRTRFRDKVLNRFLVVGLASVALTGVVGRQVIVEQNRQSVRDALSQRLGRAEAALAAADVEAGGLDAVAATLGVDVHLYRGADLEASSRRQLVRQRLIEPRLPGDVYRALFLQGEPFAFGEDRIGTFAYTTGYKVLPDSAGRPAGALAVPTISEQAAIESGQARMVAYLFGGLLALLAAVLVVAAVLAGQLTRPFRRLREGLVAVGAGGADEGGLDPIPVETRDEVGELVEAFNGMQAALAESRRKLAEQEREVAWSTMARQVAHEIKNPLMPMKLSVQYLQRTFRPPGEEAPPDDVRFAGQFERTTDMLIDQIETLNRIASDFSTFAQMPARAPEPLDLGEVAAEAAALFEGPLAESGRAVLELDLPAAPLPVLADHDELRRVLVNLLTNALQAVPDGTPGRIALAVGVADAGWAEARVTDNGTGIAADVRDNVFQPSFSTKTSGMGLGLAISKRAVEAVGGTIAFETAEGEGTTFTVRLPRVPAGDGRGGAPGDGLPAPPGAPEAPGGAV